MIAAAEAPAEMRANPAPPLRRTAPAVAVRFSSKLVKHSVAMVVVVGGGSSTSVSHSTCEVVSIEGKMLVKYRSNTVKQLGGDEE